MNTMTNSENKPQDDKSCIKQDEERPGGEQGGDDKAPGEQSESGYPDDDYWDHGVREKSKTPPAEPPEPDTGYRWESSEDGSSSEADK